MSLAAAVAGALRPSQSISWTRADGNAENLTGATLTGKICNESGITRAIAGTLAVIDGAGGVFSWSYAAEDVAAPGTFTVQFTATFGAIPTPARTIITEWVVYRALL